MSFRFWNITWPEPSQGELRGGRERVGGLPGALAGLDEAGGRAVDDVGRGVQGRRRGHGGAAPVAALGVFLPPAAVAVVVAAAVVVVAALLDLGRVVAAADAVVGGGGAVVDGHGVDVVVVGGVMRRGRLDETNRRRKIRLGPRRYAQWSELRLEQISANRCRKEVSPNS